MVEIRYNSMAGEITAKGHAGYAEEGKDIVCAAVSSLLFTLAARLVRSNSPHELRAEDGEYRLRMLQPDLLTMCAAETIVLGLRLIAEQYPEYVRFEEVRDND